MSYFFTSESVSEGHPDKVADQISDSLLDEFLRRDPNSHVACETLVTTGLVVVSGEVTCDGYVEIQDTVRDVIRRIGYTKGEYMFEANSCGVLSGTYLPAGTHPHPQGGETDALSAPRCQEPDNCRVCRQWQTPAHRGHRHLHSARRIRRGKGHAGAHQARRKGNPYPPRLGASERRKPGSLCLGRLQAVCQPHGQVRDRRSPRRHRTDRAQDYR